MKNLKNLEKEKRILLGFGLLILVYGLACFYLYYMQSIQTMDVNNRYFQSDLPFHISMIVDDGWYYSFTAYIYQVLYLATGGTTHLIAAFLAAVTVWTILLTERVIRELMNKPCMDRVTLVGAFLLNMVMPFYLEVVGAYRYVSYQSGNIWHNSTYQCMRLPALFAMLLYIRLEEKYEKEITTKEWVLFAFTLIVCTGVKPSFLTIFAPALALKLLWDLFHKVSFKQIFLLGSTVLPACLVMLWQNAVLFGEETGQGFAINPWFTFSKLANIPKLAVICSIAFPVLILICSVKELWKDKHYFFGWMMTGIGFLEALLLAETGSRSRDGNFLWGYSFGIFYIFILSFCKWVEMRKKTPESKAYLIAFILSGAVLIYQLYCGVYFWVRLMGGETYFMVK